MINDRILIVDDEELVVKAIRREQGSDFDITTAIGPIEALRIFDEEGPFAVVVSDMRMPEMTGIELLKEIQSRSPSTVRMLLTGYAELSTTIDAINKGHIFRFLTKPCGDVDFAAALRDGLKQYDLVESEKKLLEGTLQECMNVLADVLSLVSPLAFGQSTRVRSTVNGILERIDVENKWQLRLAAMLSLLGCVSIPDDILIRRFQGKDLGKDEQNIFAEHPRLAAKLIKGIPRLEHVSRIIERQADPSNSPQDAPAFVTTGCQTLSLATVFTEKENQLGSSSKALAFVLQQFPHCEKSILNALSDYVDNEKQQERTEISATEIEIGMVLADDVRNKNGGLLMSKGQTITTAAIRLLDNHMENIATGKILIEQSREALATT